MESLSIVPVNGARVCFAVRCVGAANAGDSGRTLFITEEESLIHTSDLRRKEGGGASSHLMINGLMHCTGLVCFSEREEKRKSERCIGG